MSSPRTAAACGTKKRMEKMDKDRFRQSLGGLIEAYEAVARRLGVQLD